MEIEHRVIEGRRVCFRRVDGEGPTLLFLHGVGGNSASWLPQLKALGGRFRMVAWDMPGFGQSEMLNAEPPTLADFASVARQLMDALGMDRSHVIGTSFGALTAVALTKSVPNRVQSLVLTCCVPGMGQQSAEKRAELRRIRADELARVGMREYARQRNSTYLSKTSPREMVEEVVALAGSVSEAGYMSAYTAMTEANIFPMLPGLHKPTLVVAGAEDPIAPATVCRGIAGAITGAEYTCVDAAGHYVNSEQVKAYNKMLIHFIERHEGPGSTL